MDSELATSQDWAAFQVYLSSADRVRNTVEQIWAGSQSVWKPICQQTDHKIEVTTQYGCVWKFRYLLRQEFRNWYIAAGMRCVDSGGWTSELLSDDSPHLFVELGGDNIYPEINRLAMPEGWSSAPGLWLSARPLRELPSDADGLAIEAEHWVRNRISEIALALA